VKRVSNPSSNAQFCQILRTVSWRRVLQGSLMALALACVVEPREAQAAEFYAMFTNFGTSQRPTAFLDVSGDTGQTRDGTLVLFQVFNSDGVEVGEFSLPTRNGFVSTASATAPNDNLFTLTNGGPGLIRARTPDGANNTTAELNESGRGNRLVIGISPLRRQNGVPLAFGTLFPITNGAVSSSAILVANISGSDVQVEIFVGTKGADGTGKHSIRVKPNAVGRIELTADDANSHLVMSATGDIVAQIVIYDGKDIIGVTCIAA
jgi:hypothetical protein